MKPHDELGIHVKGRMADPSGVRRRQEMSALRRLDAFHFQSLLLQPRATQKRNAGQPSDTAESRQN